MNINDPIFQDEAKAREYLENQIWPDGPYCPHCGATETDVTRLEGKAHRPGLFQCCLCREQFTATVGTVMERSHIKLTKWLLAIHLMCASKMGMSALQLQRMLGLGSYRTAWFMAHRIREAMKDEGIGALGGEGKSVQADETYYGHSSKRAKGYKKGHRHKEQIVALVEPGGKARAIHMKKATKESVRNALVTNIRRNSELHTDQSPLYTEVGREFADHKTVNHSWNGQGEYVGKDGQTTNHVENFFGIFKRGMVGTYFKCEPQHLGRYVAEFEFRFNRRSGLGVDDTTRAQQAMQGIVGKRLTYRRSREAENAQAES